MIGIATTPATCIGDTTSLRLGSAYTFADQLISGRKAYRPVGNEIAPHPVVVPDHSVCAEVRPVVEGVPVRDHHHVMIGRNR